MNALERPSSHAAYLPPVPRPPHDPLTLLMDGRVGWRPLAGAPASAIAPVGNGGALALAALPGSGRGLLEASGSFGGLVAPRHVVLAPLDLCRQDLLLYDASSHRLLRFDPCACAFVAQSCLRPGDRRLPAGPAALAAADGRLYLADRIGRRVVVLNAATLALRGVWRAPLDTPPCLEADRLDDWEPSALAIAPNGDVWVAERLHGLLLRFSPNGCVRERHAGFGTVTALAVTCAGELLVASEGTPALVFYDPAIRRRLTPPRRPAELIDGFPALPFKVHVDGSLDLSRLCQPQCAAPCVFGPDGALLDTPPEDPPERYPAMAEWTSEELDSGIADCVWDRLAIRAGLAPHTRIVVGVRTSETPLETDQVLAAEGWTQAALLRGEADADTRVETDFMLRAAPGRFLWLRLRLETNGDATPVVESLGIDYPRVSWRRYLPAVFGADPVGAEFLDRWLAIFDRGFRDIETSIDTQARLFDPMSAPADAGRDFLGFLASWVGLQGAASLPLARRRAFIRAAPALYPWRGTPRALRDTLYLFFGLARWDAHRAPNAACAPCPSRIPEHLRWRPPRMLLEHYVLRRWLWLGVGRLSDNARLWGERIVNRSPLGAGAAPSPIPGCPRPGADAARGAGCIGPAQSDAHGTASEDETARLGVTQLKTSQDPLRDPFHVHAHGLSAFVPAACLRAPGMARTLAQLLKADVPAHVQARLVPVEPRMRVGVQAMLGLDAVIGYRTALLALDGAALGKGTVLRGEDRDGGGSALRVGTRRVGMDTRLK